MKVDIRYIILDHLATLRNAGTEKVSLSDLSLFYLLPALCGLGSYLSGFHFPKSDVYNVSITFFGIFIALLLNLQVAIFGILQRKWLPTPDARNKDRRAESLQDRKTLLGEVNANLSYLILFCCLALFQSLLFYVLEQKSVISTSVTLFVYLHFLLTLIMIVKRGHALFQKEYTQ